MKYLLFLSLFNLFCSCSEFTDRKNQIWDEEKIVNSALKKAALEIKNHSELVPCGFGGGADNGVRMLALSFFYHQEATVDEARKLLLFAIDNSLKIINEDKEVQPYLKKRPFNANNVEVRIFLCNRDGSNFPPESLSYVTSVNGVFRYRNSEKSNTLYKIVKEETYEEAVSLSNHQLSN